MKHTLLLALAAWMMSPQGATPAAQGAERPPTTTVCDLAANPDSWNHRRLRVTAVADWDFESFSLSDRSCNARERSASIWLTFGGLTSPGTVYCCPGEGGEWRRDTTLTIEGVTLPLASAVAACW